VDVSVGVVVGGVVTVFVDAIGDVSPGRRRERAAWACHARTASSRLVESRDSRDSALPTSRVYDAVESKFNVDV
jgi:hypothetical protein